MADPCGGGAATPAAGDRGGPGRADRGAAGLRPDSGDEWGKTIAPFRALFERGDPGAFLHPSLFYYVTALSYAAVLAVCAFYRELRANGRVVYETSGGVELALIYEVHG